jgi:hypothetical protein
LREESQNIRIGEGGPGSLNSSGTPPFNVDEGASLRHTSSYLKRMPHLHTCVFMCVLMHVVFVPQLATFFTVFTSCEGIGQTMFMGVSPQQPICIEPCITRCYA